MSNAPDPTATLRRLFGDDPVLSPTTDPDLAYYFGRFALDEVPAHGEVDEHTRLLAVLAALIATTGRHAYRAMLASALDAGVSPAEAKEVTYHAVDYLGYGKAADFVRITNEELLERGVALPLPSQSTTTPQTRFERGWDAQAAIIGAERLASLHADALPDERHLQDWLTANCFGDNYTRGGIDLATRELLTFVLLVAHGGCDPQVRSHVAGNARVGNGRARLLVVVSQLLPYIGYPRTLNGVAAIDAVLPASGEGEQA